MRLISAGSLVRAQSGPLHFKFRFPIFRAGREQELSDDELLCPNDRTVNQVRKKCNEHRVIDRVSDGLHLSPIDVERIRETGEGVEADANRMFRLLR